MNKHVLGLALLSALGLAGCSGGDGPKEPIEAPVPGGSEPLTKVVFETSDSDGDGYTIPLPNDLLFGSTTCKETGAAQPNTDLTLNIPCVNDSDISFTGDGTRRGQAQLSHLDGWSPTAPFILKFSNTQNVSLNPATFAAGVRIFKVTLTRPGAVDPTAPISASNPKVPSGPVSAVETELELGIDFDVGVAPEFPTTAGSSLQPVLRIYPLKPLQPQASYMVVVSSALKDNHDHGVIADTTYGVVKQAEPLSDPSAAALQKLVAAQEAAAESRGMNKRDIALSWVFTVQSVNETLGAVWAYTNGLLPSPAGGMVSNPLPYVADFTTAIPISTSVFNSSNPFFTGKATIRQGKFTTPYYLTASANTSTTEPVPTGPGALIPGAPVFMVDAGLTTDMNAITNYWRAPAKIPVPGGLVANPLGTNLTYANPLPSAFDFPLDAIPVPRIETMPVLLATPADPLCVKPANGWKTVIFQHGITRNRSDVLPLAETLAAPVVVGDVVVGGCFATVAIDQPMHGLSKASDYSDPTSQALAALWFTGNSTADSNGGLRERTFGLDRQNNTTGALLVPDGKADSSGSWFINLAIPLASRDNLREASADLFGLVKALRSNTDLDVANNLYFVGQSLGSIVGTTFTAYEPGVKAAVLSVPGGGIAKLLDGSMSFGNRIRAGLAGGGVVAGTPSYETFLWLAQTLVDAGDSINTAAANAARTPRLPLLAHEVVGGFLPNYPSDLVIPNAVLAGTYPNPVYLDEAGHPTNYTVFSTGPLAGTEPLLTSLGLQAISATTADATGLRGVVRFTAGMHGSLLSPSFPFDTNPLVGGAVTQEMLKQAKAFLMQQGLAVPVSAGFPYVYAAH